MKYARLNENNIVIEIVGYDPSSFSTPDTVWVGTEDDVKINQFYDQKSKSFVDLSVSEFKTINWEANRRAEYLTKWPVAKQLEALLDKENGDSTKYDLMQSDFAVIKKKYPKPEEV